MLSTTNVNGTATAHRCPIKSSLSPVNPIPKLNGNPSDPRIQHETQILKYRPILTPTGCTPEFCQAGKRVRPLEPQLGENQPISVIKAEAEAFLREVAAEGNLFASQDELVARIQEVASEIDAGKEEALVWVNRVETVDIGRTDGEDVGVREESGRWDTEAMRQRRVQVKGWTSRGWTQKKEELEWGIRFAWRNARKCIMRAHFQQLNLCDLRHVKTSRGMIDAIIEHVGSAHNGGRIRPTVFVFPPRSVNKMGPMFISKQLLNFAGYKLPNGELLGDPINVQLTEDIIELGWIPPSHKTRWDLLPVVVMAEDDEPAMGTLPPEINRLVQIRHPDYPGEFEKLDLRWYQFPALSCLGFDIGGVQYTATPFIGWWMDAEIGVRDLPDEDRYNCFPDVLKVIGWKSKGTDFQDLAEHDKLLWLSKAQAELNYAVQYSFLQDGVTCTSTLAASKSWNAFDDQHFEEKGYRLNSDPHWLSPPQGSIVPLWHRGGLPNYQPKPMITEHRYDPVKVWRRKNNSTNKVKPQNTCPNFNDTRLGNEGLVHIFHSGTGGNAQNLAERLRRCLQKKDSPVPHGLFGVLNSADKAKIYLNDIVLLIIASTGNGEMPANGQKFFSKFEEWKLEGFPVRYAIFGLGDSGYYKTFNGAAKSAHGFFQDSKAIPLGGTGVTMSDVAIENPPSTVFQTWWAMIERALDGEADDAQKTEAVGDTYLQQHIMLKSYEEARLEFDEANRQVGRILKLGIKIQGSTYKEMEHIRLLPRTSNKLIDKVINLLGLDANSTVICIPPDGPCIAILDFLMDFVDVHEPFSNVQWVKSMHKSLERALKNESVIQVLEDVFKTDQNQATTDSSTLHEILFSMPPLRPRCYSIASSAYNTSSGEPQLPTTCTLETLIRIIPGGRFSDTCLSDLGNGGRIRCKITPSPICKPIVELADKPLIAVACGTGFAPLRSLFQLRIKQALALQVEVESGTLSKVCNEKTKGLPKTTPFLGYKPIDRDIFEKSVEEAARWNVVDGVHLVPSNQGKVRVQDHFPACAGMLRDKLVDQQGWLYVCGASGMVKDVKERLKMLLGEEVWEGLTSRVVEEVF